MTLEAECRAVCAFETLKRVEEDKGGDRPVDRKDLGESPDEVSQLTPPVNTGGCLRNGFRRERLRCHRGSDLKAGTGQPARRYPVVGQRGSSGDPPSILEAVFCFTQSEEITV